MAPSRTPSFLRDAISAFPATMRATAENAATTLAPLVDEGLRIRARAAVVRGRPVLIPYRIHFIGLNEAQPELPGESSPAVQCPCTRSTDGHVRQAALRHIVRINEPFVVPFVVLLAGEYVVEIIAELVASLSVLDRDTYAEFVRENRHLMRSLRTKTTSYWNCYYRRSYPDRGTYPGLVFLHQLEAWAS